MAHIADSQPVFGMEFKKVEHNSGDSGDSDNSNSGNDSYSRA